MAPRKDPVHVDPARRGGSHVMVRIKRALAAWASNVAISVQPKDLPDVTITRIEPSRANVIEQCVIWGLQRLDPRGRHSEFALRQARGNPAQCPLCGQQVPKKAKKSGGIYAPGEVS